ncbi:MAG: hypothetical protein J6A01_08590 [Proteobacteria bacterium]|nr:hypothetical protein [Pseudomonadota bacterium]
MNPIVRYTLLFMIWFGAVFGFYLHNKPAESLEPVQPPKPVVQIRESETQNVTLQILREKVKALETTVDAKTESLRYWEEQNEALESQISKQTKKAKSPTPKADPPKTTQTVVAQPIQREPIRPSTPQLSGGRPAKPSTGLAQRPNMAPGTVDYLSPGELKTYLNQAANRAKGCGGRGNLVMRLTIGNNGSLSRVSVISGNLKGTTSERCIINEFKNQSFPKFKNPAFVETTYTVGL